MTLVNIGNYCLHKICSACTSTHVHGQILETKKSYHKLQKNKPCTYICSKNFLRGTGSQSTIFCEIIMKSLVERNYTFTLPLLMVLSMAVLTIFAWTFRLSNQETTIVIKYAIKYVASCSSFDWPLLAQSPPPFFSLGQFLILFQRYLGLKKMQMRYLMTSSTPLIP